MSRSSSKSTAPSAQDDSVQSFIEELRKTPSGKHVVYGMVKATDGADGLLFALIDSCEHWVEIPTSCIASISRGPQAPCHGHSHPTATIELKSPGSDLEKTLSSLANLHFSRLSQPFKERLASSLICGPNQHKVTDQFGNERCEGN